MDRNEVYRRKLAVVVEELESLPPPEAELSPLEMRGVLHAVQVAIDACMDLAAMQVKDLGKDVSDDHHNLDSLVDANTLDRDLADELRRLNGLRNAIVHKYNRFEEDNVLDSIDTIRSTLYRFAEHVERRL